MHLKESSFPTPQSIWELEAEEEAASFLSLSQNLILVYWAMGMRGREQRRGVEGEKYLQIVYPSTSIVDSYTFESITTSRPYVGVGSLSVEVEADS